MVLPAQVVTTRCLHSVSRSDLHIDIWDNPSIFNEVTI